jgi:UDP-N-acetylmuramyl pentapeptide phosphotransferase/UDP-N-acetylglucosamine-1-phosphate transferase
VVGWIDDRRGLGWRSRLVVQVLVSLALLAFLVIFDGASAWTGATFIDWLTMGSGRGAVAWIGALIALLFLVGSMNAFNFMDGSNGMAGVQAVVSGAFLAWLFAAAGQGGWTLASGALAGAVLGFLPWNVPRARLFMGDAGSVPLGFVLASLVLVATYSGAAPGPLALLALAPFLVDTSLTLIRRLIRRERWYTAHRQHLYQRLIRRGWSHLAVMALYLAVNCLVLGPVLAAVVDDAAQAWLYTGTVFALMGAAWLLASRILGEQDDP